MTSLGEVIADDKDCDVSIKPPVFQTCRKQKCVAEWYTGMWSKVSFAFFDFLCLAIKG